MSKATKARPAAKKGKPGHYLLRLFIAGDGQNSQTGAG